MLTTETIGPLSFGWLASQLSHLSIALTYDPTVQENLAGEARGRTETAPGGRLTPSFLPSGCQSLRLRAIAANTMPAATRGPPLKKDTTAPPASPNRKQRRPWVDRNTAAAQPPVRGRARAPLRPRNWTPSSFSPTGAIAGGEGDETKMTPPPLKEDCSSTAALPDGRNNDFSFLPFRFTVNTQNSFATAPLPS